MSYEQKMESEVFTDIQKKGVDRGLAFDHNIPHSFPKSWMTSLLDPFERASRFLIGHARWARLEWTLRLATRTNQGSTVVVWCLVKARQRPPIARSGEERNSAMRTVYVSILYSGQWSDAHRPLVSRYLELFRLFIPEWLAYRDLIARFRLELALVVSTNKRLQGTLSFVDETPSTHRHYYVTHWYRLPTADRYCDSDAADQSVASGEIWYMWENDHWSFEVFARWSAIDRLCLTRISLSEAYECPQKSIHLAYLCSYTIVQETFLSVVPHSTASGFLLFRNHPFSIQISWYIFAQLGTQGHVVCVLWSTSLHVSC